MKRKEKKRITSFYISTQLKIILMKKKYAFLKCQNIKHFDILQLIYILSIAM